MTLHGTTNTASTAPKRTKHRTHSGRWVRRVTSIKCGGSTAYVHLLDLLTLIQRLCAITPLTMTNIQDKPHFTQLKCRMIQLLDEDIHAHLTSSSTTSVGMRSWLLLQQTAIRKSVTTRVAHLECSLFVRLFRSGRLRISSRLVAARSVPPGRRYESEHARIPLDLTRPNPWALTAARSPTVVSFALSFYSA
jgi:hypothetical protein